MIEALTKAKLKQYGFDKQSILRLTTWIDYECMLQNDRGYFFASNKENKIYSGNEGKQKHYEKSIFPAHHSEPKEKFKTFEELFRYAVMAGSMTIPESKLGNQFEYTNAESTHNFSFNVWLQNFKGWECGNEKTYIENLTRENWVEYLSYCDNEKKELEKRAEKIKAIWKPVEITKPQLEDAPKDIQYSLFDLFEGPAQGTQEYKNYKRVIQNKGCITIKTELADVRVYTAELAFIFLSKELPVTEMFKSNELKINGWDYFKTYIEGYNQGEKYFDYEFAISQDTLYGTNAELYVKDIHSNLIHIKHKGTHEGWQWVKQRYPLTLTHKEIREHGYYSGIVSKVEAMVNKYPKLFQTFDKCDHELITQQAEKITEEEQQTDNDFTLSTIEDWLFEFKDKMIETDYKTLVSSLIQYFDTGTFPTISKPIQINGRINKKLFGWALNRIFEAKGKGIEKELLQFAKKNISLFTDVQFDENNILKSLLYKYFTTKTT